MRKKNNRVIAGILVAAMALTTIIQPQAVAASGKTEVVTEQPTTTGQLPEVENPSVPEEPSEAENPPTPDQPPSIEQPPSIGQPPSEEPPTEPGQLPQAEEPEVEEPKVAEATETVLPEGTGVLEPESTGPIEREGTEETMLGEDVGHPEIDRTPVIINEIEPLEKQPAVIEVTDLDSFIQAVQEETAGDEAPLAYGLTRDEGAAVVNGGRTRLKDASRMEEGSLIFGHQRLIVISEEGFDPYGAETIIQGFDNIFVLSYRSVGETKAAYEYLKTIPYLTVEVDASFTGSAGIERPLLTLSDSIDKSLADEVEAIKEKKRDTKREEAKPEENTLKVGASESKEEDAEADAQETKVEASHEDAEAVGVNKQEGRDIKVAVIDSGYDAAGANTGRLVDGVDLTGVGDISDTNGHGTAMANIILENTPEEVKAMPVKVADGTGDTTSLKIYLGILYAMEKGADVINISLAAYKPTSAEIVARAVKEAQAKGIFVIVSAGNSGEDTAGYTPANVQEAITVSAINADGTRNEYSNYGSSIDYCSYGSVNVKGLGGKEVAASGTSVSAAIVSAVAAEVKRQDNDMAYEAVLTLLNEKAKDLGEPGKDTLFGNGALTLETIKQLQEDKLPKELPELMACDWKNLSDDALNELIAGTDYVFLRKFLDRMTEEDKKVLLSRDVMFHNNHVTVEYDEDGQEVYRDIRTLYDYLYSEDYAEYQSQYYIYHANMTAKVKLNTSLDGRNGEITVYAPGIATNPVDNDVYRKGVKVGGTSGGAIHVEKVSFKEFKTFTDDNNNVDTIGQYGVQDVVIDKPQGYHLNMTKSGDVYIYGGPWWSKKYTPTDGSWTGGYTVPSSVSGKSCSTTSVTADVMVGEWDFVATSGGKPVNQQYTLNFQEGSIDTSYGGWQITKNATCTIQGDRMRTVTHTCSKCNASFRGADKTEKIPARDHTWGGAYNYEPNNGIANGYRYEYCLKNCHESGWTRGPQFLQQIFYRFMDADGNYGGYTPAVNGYYDSGAGVPGWYFGGSLEHLPTGIGSYPSVNANHLLYDVPRKKYNIVYDGNGATGGGMGNREGICVGKAFQLSPNGYSKTGYLFQGWSTVRNGERAYTDGQSVLNLTTANNGTVTLFAIWKPITYTIAYDKNGANGGGTPNSTHTYDAPQGLRKNGYSKTGYLFQGWSTVRNGERVYTDGQPVLNLTTENNGTVTLFAIWKPIVYTIHYDGNGATGGGTQNSTHTYDQLKTLTPNGFVKDGYDFAGWSTTPDGSGERFEDGQKLPHDLSETDGAVVTLYALWKCFNVTYFRNAYEKEAEDKMKEDLHHRYSEPYEVSEYEGNNKEQGFMTVDEIMQKGILPEWEFIDNRKEDAVLRVGTREREDGETGELEEIPAVYSLAGWSVAPDSVPMVDDKEQFIIGKNGKTFKAYMEKQMVQEPQSLVDESIKYQAGKKNTRGAGKIGLPFIGEVNVSLNAIWDSYPVIHLTERFFTLEDAQAGKITQEEILSRIKVTDDEDGAGEEKILDPSKVRITDYNPELIASFDDTGSFTMRIEAEDSAKNVSTRMIKISIADTRAKEVKPPGEVRFISEKYYDDLPENSVWKADPDYKQLILNSFENLRYHEETAKIAEVKFMGKVYRKKIPGSGGWKRRPAQIWHLDHAEVLKLQAYVEENFEKSIRENNGISEEYLQGVYDMLKADGCLIEDNLPEIERQNEALKGQREREKKQEVIQEKQQKNR